MDPKQLAQFEQRFTERLDAQDEKIAATTIVGAGFSGSIGSGLSWDKKTAEAGATGTTVTVPAPPGSGDYALTSSDGVLSWTLIEDC